MNAFPGRWWHREEQGDRIVCDLCPRQCRMKEGDRGFCFVRKIENGAMVLDTYGRSTGFCIDPIEKKPLNHFYPGTSVLSFGTAGCNLGCQFCQNWDISKSREVARLSEQAGPDAIAMAARELGCRSVAFTYNDPVVWAEYAIDTARACRELGIKTVAVTAGYIMPDARRDFYAGMDAANVDLKAFSEEFYRKITYSHLEPVLDTLRYLKRETDVWFEITNLVIPDENDSADELKAMCDWIVRELGTDVPVHFSAFHPDFRMREKGNTPHETLLAAHAIARQAGIRYPYVGNVHDRQHGSTYCHACGALLIERDWYEIHQYNMAGNRCQSCGIEQAGRFDREPGNWGRRRMPVDMRRFQPSQSSRSTSPIPDKLVRWGKPSGLVTQNRVSLDNATSPKESNNMASSSLSQPTVSTPVKLDMLDIRSISEEHRGAIQRVAQHVVASAVLRQPLSESVFEPLGELSDRYVYGLFTTLKRLSHLRGCCGFLGRPTSLRDALIESGKRTALEDNRMPAISSIELPYLSCHVNLLAAPLAIDGPAADRDASVVIGQHGLRIFGKRNSRFGNQAGLLLPSVPVEQGWGVEEFLAGICRKAGMPEDAWQHEDTILERFEGLEIDGAFDAETLPDPIPYAMAPGDSQSLFRLQQAVVQNLIALSQGRTPNYVVLDAMDGTVNGIVLTAFNQDTRVPVGHWIQTSLRPGMPLQSTLFELCKMVDRTLRTTRFETNTNIDIALTIMHDPAHHGVVTAKDWDGDQARAELSDCDIRGVDPTKRGILALCGQQADIALDASKSVHQLVAEAAELVRVRNQPVTILTLGCVSTVPSLLATNRTGTDKRSNTRQPALANAFYPADVAARSAMVQAMVSDSQIQPSENAVAIMTPHAGLQYSGRIAADAWRSATLDRTLVIIGPKHTNLGADWAVSPSEAWQLPGGWSLQCDQDLAKRIVDGVGGMEFDAAAHLREHGAEVQLPILEQLIPSGTTAPKIVCIAMGGANWSEIQEAAQQLAKVLQACETMPLLVISSEMNHFAKEEENRRRDRMALDAMSTGDAKLLLETCRREQISMCGVIPAALVMETLHTLNIPFEIEQLSYDTSAKVSQDTNRVVGYAACRFGAK
ncbi:MAG: AmmeMemoRadiSam system radical SAM enzyme [Planctomycetota bacterium]